MVACLVRGVGDRYDETVRRSVRVGARGALGFLLRIPGVLQDSFLAHCNPIPGLIAATQEARLLNVLVFSKERGISLL